MSDMLFDCYLCHAAHAAPLNPERDTSITPFLTLQAKAQSIAQAVKSLSLFAPEVKTDAMGSFIRAANLMVNLQAKGR